jgi:hypothetical protein
MPLYMANPSGAETIAAMLSGVIGFIDTPEQGNKRPKNVAWCADNGCFGKGYPGDDAWFAWLEANAHDAATCHFATAPDVVGNAAATLERSRPWLPKIRRLGYKAALVAQNGATVTSIPWDEFDVLFLGGSLECLPCKFVWPADQKPARRQQCPTCGRVLKEWKLGARARALVAEAKRRGKWVHMGRVNSLKRLRYAEAIGCDSVDGTYLVFGPKKNLPKLMGWLDDMKDKPALTLGFGDLGEAA